jgi:hypothetical protein
VPGAHRVGGVEPEAERFAREVEYTAPKPGRCLSYVTFEDRNQTWMLRVIEGPSREDLTFRGVATDSESMELVSFHASSALLDALWTSPVPTDRVGLSGS